MSRRVRFGRPLPPTDLKKLVAESRADVAARLRHACANLSEDDFEILVTDIARTKVRWALEEAGEGSRVPRALRRSAWAHWWATHLVAHQHGR